MTSDMLKAIRRRQEKKAALIKEHGLPDGAIIFDLLNEVDRLNRELALTRLEVEAAWDAYDNVLEEKRSR